MVAIMADLSYLWTNTPPAAVTTSSATSSGLPDWYNAYLQGIAGKATEQAGTGYQAYPDQRLADFTPQQTQAFQNVQANQGVWQPNIGAANAIANSTAPQVQGALATANQYGANATQAASGPAQSWANNWQQYMSPYTQNVVNEIGRLGQQNMQEGATGVTDNFVGSGQFGSTRNADILGRYVRDQNQNILGQQSQALQSGYTNSANIFNTDANRAQQQQQLQASTDISAGGLASQGAQIGAAANDAAAQRLGALGQLQSSLGTTDAAALQAVGQQQQAQNQAGMDLSYSDFQNQRQYPWTTLANLNSTIRGMQLPNTQVQAISGPSQYYDASPLAQVAGMFGINNSNAKTAG